MTPEAQRLAIAQACGWTRVTKPTFANGMDEMATLGSSILLREFWEVEQLPDYLHDLNAMQEAEKSLDGKVQQADFAQRLIEVINQERHGESRFLGASQFDQMHATAAQRAKAFLRTLGLWRDDV